MMPIRLLPTAAFALLSVSAHAVPLTSAQILNQFNTVVLGSATSTSHTDGRTYIGGALSGGDYVQHVNQTPASDYAGLTVRGSATGVKVNGLGTVVGGSLTNSTVNSGSSVVKGGAVNDSFNGLAYVEGGTSGNFNGGKATTPTALMQTNLDAASSTDFGSALGALANSLKSLASTGSSVSFSGNRAIFDAQVTVDGVAVFDLSAIDEELFSKGEFVFNLNGASTVILNTDIKNANISANFLGGSAQQYGSNLLWNFYDAASLTINNQWGGSLLATGASLTNNQNIEGGVYVNSLTQRGEIHLDQFSGTLPAAGAVRPPAFIPEPGSIALMLTGLAAITLLARRRRARAG